MSALDVERRLALSYISLPMRGRLAALWTLDAALGQALAGGRDPMIGRIKLAWWGEALEALDTAPAPAEPVLQGLATHVLPAGVTGAELAELAQGWEVLASAERLDGQDLEMHAVDRGGRLFLLSARLLGALDSRTSAAGELWALADLARRSRDIGERAGALEAGRDRIAAAAGRWPARLRPLGMLAKLAARDVRSGPGALEVQGSPARMLAMLRHRLTGG